MKNKKETDRPQAVSKPMPICDSPSVNSDVKDANKDPGREDGRAYRDVNARRTVVVLKRIFFQECVEGELEKECLAGTQNYVVTLELY